MLHFAPWKTALVLVVSLFGLGWAAPNLLSDKALSSLPSSLGLQRMHLGLDLQGGSHLLFEVDMEALTVEQLTRVEEEVREALRKGDQRIGYRRLRVERGAVRFALRNPADLEAAKAALDDIIVPLPPEALTAGTFANNLSLVVNDPTDIGLYFTPEYMVWKQQQVVGQTIEVVRNRIDALGTTEPTIVQSGAGRILIQIPGLDDPDRVKGIIEKTARMTFHLVDVEGNAPASRSRVLPLKDQPGQTLKLLKRVEIEGDRLTDASPSFNQAGQPAVSIRFDARGAKKFGQITTQNVNRPFAIVLDGVILTAPNINEPILGGSAIITGSFTVQEANDLALVLRSGALPASLNILEERSVGPSLGQDSIEAGKVASVLGLALVLIFMVAVYGRFGIYSNVALLINISLIVAVLSSLQATLTLPGIAGIVLTIGMAVDANVLIFERIREEMAGGKPPFSAIEAGYKRAIETILDANITTFIAALILFAMGTGPVRGFAVTLGIGILTSVFTAFTLTRLMIAFYMNRKQPKTVTL